MGGSRWDHGEQMFWTTWFSCLQTAHTPLIYHAQQKHFACKFLCFCLSLIIVRKISLDIFCVVSPGVEGEWPPTHEKFSDPSHSGGVLGWGRGQQQEVVQEACCFVHPARPEEATLHPHCGETQDTLQETYQDHPKGTKTDLVFSQPFSIIYYEYTSLKGSAQQTASGFENINNDIKMTMIFFSFPPRRDQSMARAWTRSAV